MNLTRIYLLALLLLPLSTHAQETDVQRAELNGPVRSYKYKKEMGIPSADSIRYHYTGYFNNKGMKVVDTAYSEHAYQYLDFFRMVPYTISHYKYEENFVSITSSEIKNDDTVEKSTEVIEFNKKGQPVLSMKGTITKKDTTRRMTRYEYYGDGKLKEELRASMGSRHGWIPELRTAYVYTDRNKETFCYNYRERDTSEHLLFRDVDTYDDKGRLIRSLEYFENERRPYIREYIYADSKQIPSIKRKFFKGSRYLRYIYWHKDQYGNYLENAYIENGKPQSQETYTIEYYE